MSVTATPDVQEMVHALCDLVDVDYNLACRLEILPDPDAPSKVAIVVEYKVPSRDVDEDGSPKRTYSTAEKTVQV